mmetsp:Transcript_29700/g.52192  ORF Transcript_29700/g.52192 Transcript_29700/m.52192 type:complete len:202 (+) Transcript_29700:2102-2707(+)
MPSASASSPMSASSLPVSSLIKASLLPASCEVSSVVSSKVLAVVAVEPSSCSSLSTHTCSFSVLLSTSFLAQGSSPATTPVSFPDFASSTSSSSKSSASLSSGVCHCSSSSSSSRGVGTFASDSLLFRARAVSLATTEAPSAPAPEPSARRTGNGRRPCDASDTWQSSLFSSSASCKNSPPALSSALGGISMRPRLPARGS